MMTTGETVAIKKVMQDKRFKVSGVSWRVWHWAGQNALIQ
jgi:hypothetical protein